MVKLIMGLKGMGKTKMLIDMVNEAAKNDKGDVVCIEKGKKLTYDISHDVRLIDVTEYEISDFNSFYGFICGILAQDYDISAIFIDSVLKICSDDFNAFSAFLTKIEKLSEEQGKEIILTASGDQAIAPESVKRFFAA